MTAGGTAAGAPAAHAGQTAGTGPAAGGHRDPAARPAVEAALPLERLDAVLSGLDGVLTDTAGLHQAAWTEVSGELSARAGQERGSDRPDGCAPPGWPPRSFPPAGSAR